MTIDALYTHTQKVLEVRHHASNYQTSHRNPTLRHFAERKDYSGMSKGEGHNSLKEIEAIKLSIDAKHITAF